MSRLEYSPEELARIEARELRARQDAGKAFRHIKDVGNGRGEVRGRLDEENAEICYFDPLLFTIDTVYKPHSFAELEEWCADRGIKIRCMGMKRDFKGPGFWSSYNGNGIFVIELANPNQQFEFKMRWL